MNVNILIEHLSNNNSSMTWLDIEHLSIDNAITVADALSKNTKIVEVKFSNTNNEVLSLILDVVKTHPTITSVHISDLELGISSTIFICDILKCNKNIITFRMSNLELSVEDAKLISEALASNNTLIELSLDSNLITSDSMRYFADVLCTNDSIKTVHVADNGMLPDTFGYFGDVLICNSTLETLDLSVNDAGERDIKKIADALQHNTNLKTLSLSSSNVNYFDDLIRSLKNNNTLKKLTLHQLPSFSYIYKHKKPQKSPSIFGDVLKYNQSIEYLCLMCDITNTDAVDIAEGIVTNKTLTFLEFERLLENSFEIIVDALEHNNTITALNTGTTAGTCHQGVYQRMRDLISRNQSISQSSDMHHH